MISTTVRLVLYWGGGEFQGNKLGTAKLKLI